MKKNTMKRILSMALALAMSLTLCIPAFARNGMQEDESDGCTEYAERTIERLNDSTRNFAFSLSKGIEYRVLPLYNELGKIIAYCYSLSPLGYVIIDSDTGMVIEYSEDTQNPYAEYMGSNISCYYGGPLNYYVGNDEYIIHTITSCQIPLHDLNSIQKDSHPSLKNKTLSNYQRFSSWITYGEIDGTLTTSISTQQNGNTYYCVPTAIAILLSYYGAFPNGAGVTGSNIREYLFSNYYIANKPQWLSDAKNGYSYNAAYYSGLQSYANHVSSLNTIYVDSYLYSKVYTQIVTNHRPVIIELPTSVLSSSSSGMHAVSGYKLSYNTSSPDYTYISVNTGWGTTASINMDYLPLSYDIMYMN